MGVDAGRLESCLTEGFSEEELETLYRYLDRLQTNIDNALKNAQIKKELN